MVSLTYYKDRPAVRIYNGRVAALFLPEDGGKLASLKFDGKEFLAQREGEKYLRLRDDTSYVNSECSAFDDMFPTIDPCVIDEMVYPDHGEVSRSAFEYKIAGDTARFSCYVRSVNAFFSKTAYCDGEKLLIKYEIENKNDFTLPYIWAGHIMLCGEEGTRIVSKYSDDIPVTVAFGNPPKKGACTLGKYGTGKEYKFYYDEAMNPMECSVLYPSSECRIDFSFTGEVVKHLGVWMNPGDLNGMYNAAIEPCTAPYDTPIKAEKAGKGSYISSKSKVEFTLMIRKGKNDG